jgi:hypothetical protein
MLLVKPILAIIKAFIKRIVYILLQKAYPVKEG